MNGELYLRLTRVIKAPREKCFAAWTKPEALACWLAPSLKTVSEASADVRVGGEYRIVMSGDSGNGTCANAAVTGVYKEVVPNNRLTFTWCLLDEPYPETLVTVEFKEVEQGTELTLTHQGFIDEDTRAQHERGWKGCLDSMEHFVTEEPQDYTRVVNISAPCEKVFDALATLDGPKGWWTPLVSGSAETGGDLRFAFTGVEGDVLMHVDHATRPDSIQWTCVESTVLPDWEGTVVMFDLIQCTPDSCALHFRHHGLTPALECFELCNAGWNYYLPSLKAYAETGAGTPGRRSRDAE